MVLEPLEPLEPYHSFSWLQINWLSLYVFVRRQQKTPSKSITWGFFFVRPERTWRLLHIVDHDLPETGTADLGRTIHQTRKVVCNFFALDRLFH